MGSLPAIRTVSQSPEVPRLWTDDGARYMTEEKSGDKMNYFGTIHLLSTSYVVSLHGKLCHKYSADGSKRCRQGAVWHFRGVKYAP